MPWEDLVFLDKHLEGLPRDGPLGLFFEAAADGLSQNPFISLDEKLEHLEWFRQYFVKYEEDLLNMDAVQSGDLDTRKFFTYRCRLSNPKSILTLKNLLTLNKFLTRKTSSTLKILTLKNF